MTPLIPLFQKQRYLKSLTEDDFRDRIVRPLFIAMGLEHAKDTCGPAELGKDCYFWHTDPLRRSLYAVQTKRGDIKMSASARDNLLNAVTQLRTALSVEIPDAVTRSKRQPTCVILCTSGEINHAAERHIVDDIKDSRLELRDSNWLIPRIDQFIPEVWNGIDVDKLPYLKGLRDFLIHQSATIDVSGIGLDASTPVPITEDTFCQIYLHRYTTKFKKVRGRKEENLELDELTVQELLNRPDNLILLTGEAGSGKTTSLNRLAMILVERSLQSKATATIPVRLSVRDLNASADSLIAIASARTQAISKQKVNAFDDADLNAGRVVLLIDGLDELGTDDERTECLTKLMTFTSQYKRCKVILATRDYPFVREIIATYHFERFHITPISNKQAEKMIQRLAKTQQLSKADTQEFLRRLENVHGLELNPLLVTIFVASSDYSRSDIPANITELFKKFVEVMLGRWNKSKGVAQLFHPHLKDFILQKLAFRMHVERTTSIPVDECKKLVEHELQIRGHAADVKALFTEIVESSGLMIVLDDQLSFRHMLLQEYFAGRAIPTPEWLAKVVTDVWWSKALIFYFGENPDDSAGLAALRSGLSGIVGGDEFQAAVTVGLATQACYLMTTDDKVESMRWVIDRLSDVDEKTLGAGGSDSSQSLLAMIYYYLYGRDAVAAKFVAEVADSMIAGEEQSERKTFWAIAGLIESRQMDRALEEVQKFQPTDQRLLLALHIGAHYVHDIHVTNPHQKKVAGEILAHLRPKIEYMVPEIINEIKTMLLEIRDGTVMAIEGKVEGDSDSDAE